MRLFVAIELADRCGTEPMPAAAPDNRSVDPRSAGDHPLAAFVAQLMATYLRPPQTRARRRCAQDQASGSYTAASSLSWPERPRLDRSV
jgi:hypothetical protein